LKKEKLRRARFVRTTDNSREKDKRLLASVFRKGGEKKGSERAQGGNSIKEGGGPGRLRSNLKGKGRARS